MEQFIQFLVNYWQYISSGILALLSIIVMIIKNRPSAKDALLLAVRSVIDYLPNLVSLAEEAGGSGSSKKEHVIGTALELVESRIGRDLTGVEFKQFYDVMSTCIEAILNAPTKKGGHGREDE